MVVFWAAEVWAGLSREIVAQLKSKHF
jgi:hypothetical protein